MTKKRKKQIKKESIIPKEGNLPISSFYDAGTIDYPIFCFKHLYKDYHLDKCENDDKRFLVETLVRISGKTWQDLQTAPKGGIGCEKIAVTSIKTGKPKIVTEDVKHLLAFRFSGKKAMVGIRIKSLFHLLYLDRDFTLYDHGS